MKKYQFETSPIANPANVIQGPKYRFTVLTEKLIRYEWAEDGVFEDRASTFAIKRDLPPVDFDAIRNGNSLEILTNYLHLTYDGKNFSPSGLTVTGSFSYSDSKDARWRYGEIPSGNLGGTIRTLDNVNGRIDLGLGIMTRHLFSVVDDSKSVLFGKNGFFEPRRPGDRIDGYLFGYGLYFQDALDAFYAISGSPPNVPRWALGNWWSRYYRYDQAEYMDLIDKFKSENVPLSVAVLDMDWHLVDDNEVSHSGWTGYTWNKSLFPDPHQLKEDLAARNLKLTLNDHPHLGVHSFEDSYASMADAVGIDSFTREPVEFDASNPRFMEAYFNILHTGLEKIACDFWWIDWQQGEYSAMPGLDPLWALNHFQYLDTKSKRHDPLILSRYAGPGSHRYPIGFSGDSHITWDSLAFQSELTATASNIGYTWWSHDIGGHMFGKKENELLVRWVQLGVFSPIMRLHSTDSQWNSKEPWLFVPETKKIMIEFLQYRHRLVPYIHSQTTVPKHRRRPLIRPMYWLHPTFDEAYQVPNQFLFGTSMMISPIITRRSPTTGLAKVDVWIPMQSRFVDLFTGTVYDPSRKISMYRPLNQLPVLVPEGGIVIMDCNKTPSNGCVIPDHFEAIVVIGRNIQEDFLQSSVPNYPENVSLKYAQRMGVFEARFIGKQWTITFLAVDEIPSGFKVEINGTDVTNETNVSILEEPTRMVISLPKFLAGKVTDVVINLGENPQLSIQDPKEKIRALLQSFEIEYEIKDKIWNEFLSYSNTLMTVVSNLLSSGIDESILNPIFELLMADSRYKYVGIF